MKKTVSSQNASVVSMTKTASHVGVGTEPHMAVVSTGLALSAATELKLLSLHTSRQPSDEPSTRRPQSKRRQFLLQTSHGQVMQAQALQDVGSALSAHGLAPM